jgi:HK97 family phage portal protein
VLSRLLGGAERRAFTSSNAIPKNSDGWSTAAGEPVSERTALQQLAVYACVRLLADSIAGLPMDVYRKNGVLRTEVSPTPSLITSPSPDLQLFEWVHQTVTSLALRGNFYGFVMSRDKLEYPTTVEPLHPDSVQVEHDKITDRLTYRLDGKLVPNADVVHIRRFTLPGCRVGLSPIDQARQGIGLSLAAERYGARFFGDSASPSGALETDQNLTEDQATRTMKSWVSSHAGRRHPAVLSGGLKWRPLSIMPDESQFLQTRKFQRGEIAMMFGVPPHMIGDTERSTSWGTGIEQQSIGFVRYTLRPWLICIEQALSALLPRGQFVRFNADALLRGDTMARYQAYKLARESSWLNANEIRALEDLPPIANGDDYLQPLNFGPLGTDPTDNPAPPAPAPEEDEDDEDDQA